MNNLILFFGLCLISFTLKYHEEVYCYSYGHWSWIIKIKNNKTFEYIINGQLQKNTYSGIYNVTGDTIKFSFDKILVDLYSSDTIIARHMILDSKHETLKEFKIILLDELEKKSNIEYQRKNK